VLIISPFERHGIRNSPGARGGRLSAGKCGGICSCGSDSGRGSCREGSGGSGGSGGVCEKGGGNVITGNVDRPLSSELSRASSPALVPCSTLSATTGFTDLEPWNSENTLAFVIILTTDFSEGPFLTKEKVCNNRLRFLCFNDQKRYNVICIVKKANPFFKT